MKGGYKEDKKSKIESKYVIKRIYKAMGKRGLDSIQNEKVEQIHQHDSRFKKLINSESAPKQIEDTADAKQIANKIKGKTKEPMEFEYVIA